MQPNLIVQVQVQVLFISKCTIYNNNNNVCIVKDEEYTYKGKRTLKANGCTKSAQKNKKTTCILTKTKRSLKVTTK